MSNVSSIYSPRLRYSGYWILDSLGVEDLAACSPLVVWLLDLIWHAWQRHQSKSAYQKKLLVALWVEAGWQVGPMLVQANTDTFFNEESL
jgi:hypothetical protein